MSRPKGSARLWQPCLNFTALIAPDVGKQPNAKQTHSTRLWNLLGIIYAIRVLIKIKACLIIEQIIGNPWINILVVLSMRYYIYFMPDFSTKSYAIST